MNQTILIVEDESIVAKDLQKRLTNLGYQVVGIVATGEEAVRRTGALQPELVLMDIRLKGEMDGIAAAAEIRFRFGTAVIFLTAYADQDTLKRASQTEPFGYLLKPFEERELQTTIEMALYRREVDRRLRENEHWFATTLRSLGEAVIATDASGAVRFMNAAAESLTGWRLSEAADQDLSRIFRTVELQKNNSRNPVQQILKNKVTAVLKNHAILIARDGREIPIDESASPIKDDHGETTGVVLVFKDTTEKKRAQDALQTSQGYAESILNSSLDMIIAVDLDRNITQFNSAAESTFGYTAPEVIGKHINILYVDPDEGAEVNRLVATEGKEVRVVNNRRKNGEVFPCLLSSSVLRDGNGEKIGYMGISRDITERRRSEKALRESEERYRKIVDFSPDPIAVHVDGRVVFVNTAGVELFGANSAEEVVGKSIFDFVHPDYRPVVAARVRAMVEEGKQVPMIEEKLLRSDGRLLEAEVVATPLVWEGEQAVQVMVRDISLRRKAELAIRASEIKYRTLFENVLDGIYQSTPKGEILTANPALARLLGYDNEMDLLMVDMRILYEQPDLWDQQRERLERDGQIRNVEHVMRRKDGSLITVMENSHVVRSKNGEILYFEGTLTDISEHKRLVEGMRKSEERFKAFLEQSAEGVYCMEFEQPVPIHLPVDEQIACMFEGGVVTECNGAMAAMYGLPSSDSLIGKRMRELLIPDDPANLEYLRNTIRSGYRLTDAESKELDSAGDVKYFLNNFVGIMENGCLMRFWGTQRDVTTQRRMEIVQDCVYWISEKTDSVGSLQELYKVVHDAVARVMLAKNFYIALYDAPTDLVSFPYFVDEVDQPDETRHPGKGLTEYVLRKGKSLLCTPEVDRLLSESNEVELVGVASPTWLGVPLISNGRTIGVMAVQDYQNPHAYDETDQRVLEFVSSQVARAIERTRASAALRESEERYREFFEQDLAGHYISTIEGKFLVCNPAFAKIFGYDSVADVLVQPALSLYVTQNQRKEFQELLKREKRLEGVEMEARRKDGEIVHVLQNVVGIFDAGGDLRQIRGYVIDISERRNLEERLRQAQRLESIGTLASGIAHDFNNILTIISSCAHLIQRDAAGLPGALEQLEAINQSVDRGAGIVRQVLLFSRNTVPEKVPMDLLAALTDVIALLSKTFPERVRIVFNQPREAVGVIANLDQLHQLFMNVLLNARDALSGEGSVTVHVESVPAERIAQQFPDALSRRYAHIWIEDSGKGMSDDVRRRIFEPFFTTKDVGQGVGLGLSVAYGVVRSHHGFIDVESTVGRGTTFHIYLPMTDEGPPATGDADGGKSKLQGSETILLVEDEEVLLDLLQMVFEENGYRVLTAANGLDAVGLFKQHLDEIAIVLSDMGLPKLGGWEMFQQMKEIKPGVKAILASGYLDPDLRESLLNAGAADFIQKPYIPDHILRRVREVLELP